MVDKDVTELYYDEIWRGKVCVIIIHYCSVGKCDTAEVFDAVLGVDVAEEMQTRTDFKDFGE